MLSVEEEEVYAYGLNSVVRRLLSVIMSYTHLVIYFMSCIYCTGLYVFIVYIVFMELIIF